ncbi:MAG: hypothetical protein KKI08_18615 [Armatimonadetes bacterium]|nr:hypothetical protein [Armatimonadota bacterium]
MTAPDSPHFGSERLLDIACRAGDAIRDFQYPDGQVEFIKADGSKWGPTYMPWTNYAWLEAYALLRDQLGDERRQRWEEGLTLAHDGQAREISNGHVHNIPAWKGMSCVRAGQLFGRDDWRQAGEAMIAHTVAAQDEAGYWPEHGGPSTLYNLVYVHALGLYHAFTGDESVLPALRAATEFHNTFTYPDGAVVETIDGRVKYHARVAQFAWPAFSLFPVGRSLVRHLVASFDATRDSETMQGGCLASAFHHVQEGPEAPCSLDEVSFARPYRDWAVAARQGPWFACLSAFVCPPVNSRWGQDRQSFLSLWHERAGLIIGGGNSKIQPEWSTFAAGGRFMPDSGVVRDGEVVLEYGEVRCTLKLDLSDGAATVTAGAQNGLALHDLVLNMKRGQRLRTAAGLDVTLGDEALALGTAQLGEWSQFGDCRITIPHGAELHWPSYAYNPYAIDAAPPDGSEMGVLSARLDNDEVTWRVTVTSY